MSVEHGSHHAETLDDIISTLFLALLVFPFVISAVEETVEEVATGGVAGHGGH